MATEMLSLLSLSPRFLETVTLAWLESMHGSDDVQAEIDAALWLV